MLDQAGRAVEHVTVSSDGDSLKLAGATGTQLHVISLEQKENMMTGEMTREQTRVELPQMSAAVKAIYIDPRQQWLYVINGRAQADVFSLRDRSLNGRYKLLEDGNAEITASAQLVGGISLIIGNQGQYVPVVHGPGH